MGWYEERFEPTPDRMRFDCIVCSKGMWFPKSKHGKYKTCGPECVDRQKAAVAESRLRSCEACGGLFKPRLRQLRVGQGRFCSQKCNVASHAALNSQAAQLKAKAAWRLRHQLTPIVKSGHLNPRWNGGPKAAYGRRKASGATRIAWQNRQRSKNGERLSSGIAKRLLVLQRCKCAICATSLKPGYHMDHIEPLSKGGRNVDENIQLLCPACNRSKHAADPIEYMQSLGRLL